MREYPRQLEILINELSKLPGVGEKSAQRLAFHILDKDESQVEALADALLNAKRQLKHKITELEKEIAKSRKELKTAQEELLRMDE